MKILDLLTSNVAIVGKLAEEKQFVIIINTTDRKIAVPVLPKGSAMYGYYVVGDDEISEQNKDIIDGVVDTIIKSKKFMSLPTKLNINGCTTFPEHSHEIVDIIKPVVTGFTPTIPDNFDDICKELGYVYNQRTCSIAVKPRDYSEASTDPEFAKLIKDNHLRVAELHNNFEDIPNEAKVAFFGLKNGLYDGIVFKGETGTGKTELCRILADKLGAPLYEKQVDGGTRVEDFVGEFVPCSDKTGFEFREGPLLKAYYKGGTIKVDEILNANAETLAKLNTYLDGSPYVIENGVVYHKHPNFFMLATCNPGYEGTMPMNVSLKGRLSMVEIPAIDKKTFCAWSSVFCKNLGKEFDKSFYEKLFDLAALIEKEGSSPKWHENFKFSIRNAQRFYAAIIPQDLEFDVFAAAFHVQYTNVLSMDVNNADQLKVYKEGDLLKTKLTELFNIYNQSKSSLKVSSTVISLDDLLKSIATDSDKINIDDIPADGITSDDLGIDDCFGYKTEA